MTFNKLRDLVERHRYMGAGSGVLKAERGGTVFVHPLDPRGAGGMLALAVLEALETIIRNQETMQDQLNRLNSIIDGIGTRLGNVGTDIQQLQSLMASAAAGDSELDVQHAADRLQAISDNLSTLQTSLEQGTAPAAVSQAEATAPPASDPAPTPTPADGAADGTGAEPPAAA